jgi:hypothetical protein
VLGFRLKTNTCQSKGIKQIALSLFRIILFKSSRSV